MRRRASVVIVGGGVNGLGTAWRLAREGVTDIVVLERRYILYGASGRNGGGVRAQWGTPDNLELARESLREFRSLSAELGFHIWFRQGGYLFLAYDEKHLEVLRRNVALQNSKGVPSRLVTPEEARILAPELNVEGVVGGTFSPTDGVLFPWSVVQGYFRECRRMGVDVETFTEVTGFGISGNRIVEVETTKGSIQTEWVVNAAGAWSREVAALAGVKLPNRPVRHEILVLEALEPFLDPMVVDLRTGLYASQDMRGEVVSGMAHGPQKEDLSFGNTLGFLRSMAQNLVHLFPRLSGVRLLRQWSGAYDVTPDNKPILGPTPGLENFLQLNGASGHGFMISPATTRLTAEILLGRTPHLPLEPYLLDRFERPLPLEPDAMVIG